MKFSTVVPATLVEDILSGRNPSPLVDLKTSRVNHMTPAEFAPLWFTQGEDPKARIESTVNDEFDDLALGFKFGRVFSEALEATMPPKDKRHIAGKRTAEYDAWLGQANQMIAWLHEHTAFEVQTLALRYMINVAKLPFDTTKLPAFDTYAVTYKDIILNIPNDTDVLQGLSARWPTLG